MSSEEVRVIVEVRDEATGAVLFRGKPAEPHEYINVRAQGIGHPARLTCHVSDLSASLRPVGSTAGDESGEPA
jgi:hypothetical protein